MALSAKATALALMLWLWAAPGAAQDTLTLDGAIREVLAHNATLRSARADAAEASERVTEARAGWFPRVSFAESWQRGGQPVFVFSSLLASRNFKASNFAIDSLNHPDPIGFFRGSLAAEQLLFDGGRQRTAITGARLRSDMSKLAIDEAAASLVSAATETYGRILVGEAGARAAHAAVEWALEDVATAERRRDAGMATDADVLALVSRVATLRQREIDSQADAAVAMAELNRLTGAPIDRHYKVSEPFPRGDLAGMTLSAAFAEADANRPEMKRATAAIQLAETERKAGRAAVIPQVTAQAAFDLSGTSVNDRQPAWIVGGELRWSLSLGGAELARSKAASHAQVRAAAAADDIRAAVRVEVVTAFRRLEAARARQAVGQAAVNQAQERQRIIRDRFAAGMTGVTEVLQASSALTDAEAQRIGAVVDAVNGEALLRRAIGRSP
ncbi:MAG TPA: TolC family protein [Vicinamibacterales bacterium]|nr:TolC family protein [Vicinamibacterales bacterium]